MTCCAPTPASSPPASDAEAERRAALTRLFDYYLHTAATAMDTLFPASGTGGPASPPGHPAPPVTGACRGTGLAAIERANLVAAAAHSAAHDERFRVLTGGDRSALPRHQTMRALIDWSYDLLSDAERSLFRTLSIFAGGFTLETACAVGSDERIDEIAMLDLLSSLVDKSLVQTELGASGTRYRLLESTRQYARERLTDAGEYEAVAHAHATTFLALTEEVERIVETTPDGTWLGCVEPESENYRAALRWAFGAQGNALLAQRLAGTLRLVWVRLGPAEGCRWVQAAQELVGTETPARVVAALDLAEAHLLSALTQHKASYVAGKRALVRYCELAQPLEIASAQRFVGYTLVMLGRIAEGEELLEQACNGARVLKARRLTASVLQGLATARYFAGDIDGARPLFGEALAIVRAIAAEHTAASLAGDLAEAEFAAAIPRLP